MIGYFLGQNYFIVVNANDLIICLFNLQVNNKLLKLFTITIKIQPYVLIMANGQLTEIDYFSY